jgi:hypothetical protein
LVLDSDVLGLFGAGAAIIVGTVGPDGEPRATRGWSVRSVDADTGRIRVMISADDPLVVGNLAGSRIAVGGAEVRTLRSAQVKGRVVSVETPTAEDLADMAHDSERFFVDVHVVDGNPLELLRRLLPHDVVAVEIEVEEQYDQSPGPGAGEPVRASS